MLFSAVSLQGRVAIILFCVFVVHKLNEERSLSPTQSSAVLPVSGATGISPARKIFIDLGANCGNSYEKIKRSSDVNGHTDILKTTDWQVYLWEANPTLVQLYLKDVEQKNSNVHVIASAAATDNMTLQFYLTEGQDVEDISQLSEKDKKFYNYKCDPDSDKQPAGASSLVADVDRAGKAISVPALNFPQWLQDLQINPSQDRLVLKIDIEGAELDILDKIMTSPEYDAICHASPLLIEWHARLFPVDSDLYKKHNQFRIEFPARYEKKCNKKLDMMNWH